MQPVKKGLDLLKVVMPCRELQLDRWAPLQLPPLALQSFAWTSILGVPATEAEVQCIGALTTLTSLELNMLENVTDVKPLQSLPHLQKLTMEGCAKLGEQLLQPGAFPSMTELRIDDDYPEDEEGYPDVQKLYSEGRMQIVPPAVVRMIDSMGLSQESPSEVISEEALTSVRNMMEETAMQCMSVVMQMPRIKTVSGNATLLKLGLAPKPQGWAEPKGKYDRVAWTKH